MAQFATIRNDFHGTVARVQVGASGCLSKSQVNRVRRTLCGCGGCTCGGDLSERGPQQGIEIIEEPGGRVFVKFDEDQA